MHQQYIHIDSTNINTLNQHNTYATTNDIIDHTQKQITLHKTNITKHNKHITPTTQRHMC